MPEETLTPTEEARLIRGVKQAVDYVDKGLSPTEALIKVARAERWTPGYVRAGVNAFNNGRQLAQWQSEPDALSKLAEFPLADYDAVHNAIWGGSTKEARDAYIIPISVHPDYQLPPAWIDPGREKRAVDLKLYTGESQANTPEHQALIDKEASDRRMRRAWSTHNMQKRAVDAARSRVANAHDRLAARVTLLENYFRKMAMDRCSFEEVDHTVGVYFGDSGKALMNCLAEKFPREKRASDQGKYRQAVNLETAPYTLVKLAIDAAKDIYHLQTELETAEAAEKQAAETLLPFAVAPQCPNPSNSLSVCLIPESEKVAASGLGIVGASAIGATTKSLLDQALGPGGKQEAIDDQWLALEDPEHDNELEKIRGIAMLSNMMADKNNPISGHDPESVLSAYNNLSQLAPRAVRQPAALQPLLAKQLSGHLEPFEVQQITDLEKNLLHSKATTPNTTRLLSESPTSLLG